MMLTPNGPRVLEFNCRFGDPETQCILPRMATPLLTVLLACVEGRLTPELVAWKPGACVCVVMAAGGYPGAYEKGARITGIEEALALDQVAVFHAGTARRHEAVCTDGGRVLGVTATGSGIAEAVKIAYHAVLRIKFDNAHYRHRHRPPRADHPSRRAGCRACEWSMRPRRPPSCPDPPPASPLSRSHLRSEKPPHAFSSRPLRRRRNGRNAARLEALAAELAPFSGCAATPPTFRADRLLAAAPRAFGAPADLSWPTRRARGCGFRLGIPGTAADCRTLACCRRAAAAWSRSRNDDSRAPATFPRIGAGVRLQRPYGQQVPCMLAESLRRDIGPQGVRVSLVEPGFVLSGFQEVAGYSAETVQGFKDRYGPLLDPGDVARAILFMVSQPPHVHIGDLVLRPTRQDYP